MQRVLIVAMMLVLLACGAFAAPHVHVRIRKQHRNQQLSRNPDSNSKSSSRHHEELPRAACPMQGEPLAAATQPALTTSCPSSCSTNDLCIYYPSAFTSQCTTTSARTCYHGETCAFQCVTNAEANTGWFITLYTDDAVLGDVNAMNVKHSDQKSIAINATQVTTWLTPLKLGEATFIEITGNEPANGQNRDTETANTFYEDLKSLTPDEIVPFELPVSFFEDVQKLETVRLENVRFPMPRTGAVLSFPNLGELMLKNTRLTSFPFPRAEFPLLTYLDLSVNNIQEISRGSLPPGVYYLNLAQNAITNVKKGAFSKELSALNLASNEIGSIPAGTLPKGLEYLDLNSNLLTQIPRDIARMKDLTLLDLAKNALGEIPEGTIPNASLSELTLDKCGLVAVPPIVKTMSSLTLLSLNGNDLSRNPDFSGLPSQLEKLHLDSCQLGKVPDGLDELAYLETLSIMDNRHAMQNLPVLPDWLVMLDLSNNSLEALPASVRRITALSYLSLMSNPLSNLETGSMPPALTQLDMSDATFRAIPNGTLPATLEYFTIENSLLEQAPEDIRTFRNVLDITITSSALRDFDVASNLPVLRTLNLKNNQLVRCSGRFPVLTTLDLRNNSLVEFNVTSAPQLQTLQLASNQFTAMPRAVFQLPELLLLNLSHNPIRNYTPSAVELAFLARVPVVVMQQSMFASDCDKKTRTDLRGYSVCVASTGDATKSGTSKISAGLILLNLCLALALGVLFLVMWRRRQLQKKRLLELDVKTKSLDKQQKLSASIWADTVLLQHRLDDDLIVKIRLLGSGMFGDVYLATYKSENVALKRLKGEASTDRAMIQQFVEEIKLVSTLSHPRVVKFVGVVWTKETDIALVTEFMAGGDLRAYLDSNAKQTAGWTQRMVKIALHITEAIVYLHSMEPVVIHRDLKSRNVLLSTRMHAKLSDFGISRYKLDGATMTGNVGTIRWVAPEVLAGKRYDQSVDIYSLGIILGEIDTHELPFFDVTDDSGSERLTDSAIAGLVLSGSLTTSFSASCPSEIQSLAQSCTAFDAANRPTGLHVAYELRKMLRAYSWANGDTTMSRSSRADTATMDDATATERTVDIALLEREEHKHEEEGDEEDDDGSMDTVSIQHISV